MRFLMDINYPLPPAFQSAAQLVLNANLRRALSEAPVDAARVQELVAQAIVWHVSLDGEGLAYALRGTMLAMANRLVEEPGDLTNLQALEEAAGVAHSLPFPVHLSEVQNRYWQVLKGTYQSYRERASHGDPESKDWAAHFRELGVRLSVSVE